MVVNIPDIPDILPDGALSGRRKAEVDKYVAAGLGDFEFFLFHYFCGLRCRVVISDAVNLRQHIVQLTLCLS